MTPQLITVRIRRLRLWIPVLPALLVLSPKHDLVAEMNRKVCNE